MTWLVEFGQQYYRAIINGLTYTTSLRFAAEIKDVHLITFLEGVKKEGYDVLDIRKAENWI